MGMGLPYQIPQVVYISGYSDPMPYLQKCRSMCSGSKRVRRSKSTIAHFFNYI